MNRLFCQDRLIAANTIRATFAGWHDRAIATFTVLFVLAVNHAWFANRPRKVAAWTALGAGTLIGIAPGHFVGGRRAFHAFDALLAADALSPQTRRRLMAAWHGVGLAILAVATRIERPSLLVISVPAHLASVFIAEVKGAVTMPKRIAGTALQTNWHWGGGEAYRRQCGSPPRQSVPSLNIQLGWGEHRPW